MLRCSAPFVIFTVSFLQIFCSSAAFCRTNIFRTTYFLNVNMYDEDSQVLITMIILQFRQPINFEAPYFLNVNLCERDRKALRSMILLQFRQPINFETPDFLNINCFKETYRCRAPIIFVAKCHQKNSKVQGTGIFLGNICLIDLQKIVESMVMNSLIHQETFFLQFLFYSYIHYL
jgi:hypothetical protein